MSSSVPLNVSIDTSRAWLGGYIAIFTVQNPSSKNASSWTIVAQIPANQTIATLWGAQSELNGQLLTITNLDGVAIPSGQSIQFGFVSLINPIPIPTIVEASGNSDDQVQIPAAPSLMSVTQSGSIATALWSAVDGATSYLLEQDIVPTFDNPKVLANQNALSFLFALPAPGTYVYRVQASNTAGSGDFSNFLTLTVLPQPLAAPVLSLSTVGNNSFVLNWTTVLGATSYTLQVDSSSSFPNPQVAFQGSVTAFPVPNVPGSYAYRVEATNSTSTSAFSNAINVTVQTPPPPTTQTVEGYWESWDDTVSVSTIANMKVDTIDIAFANFKSQSTAHTFTISGIESNATVVAQLVTAAHGLGKKVKLSVGGESYPLAGQLKTTDDALGMAKAIQAYIQQTGIDGVDLDIEDNTPAALQIALIQDLRQLLGQAALISYTAGTPASSTSPFKQVIDAAHPSLTSISLMAYDAGSSYSYPNDISALVGQGVPIAKVMLGLMPGKDDEGHLTAVQDIATAANYVKQNGLYGIMLWDANRDFKNTTGLGVDAFTNTAYPIIHS